MRPIASIAFHAQGELLAVASGHKVRAFSWKFDIIIFIFINGLNLLNLALVIHMALQ